MIIQELKEKLLATKCFIDNEYLDKYCELIELNKDTKKEKYKTQIHHIIPKCYYELNNLEIDNSKENLVNLLYKDHFLSHYYLALFSTILLEEKLTFACVKMSFRKTELKDINLKELDSYQYLYEKNNKYLAINNKNIFVNFYTSGDTERINNCLKKKSESGKKFYASLSPEEKEARDRKRILAILNMDEETKEKRSIKIKNSKLNISEEEKHNLGIKINNGRGWENFEDVINRVSKEVLYNYYIVENHNKKETEIYFNISDSRLDKILRFYNIYKFSPRMAKRKEIQLDIENFKFMYLDMNYSVSQLCNYYSCKEGIIYSVIKDNNIGKRRKE